ncbi:MAG: hypothetical protein H8E55_29320 [Pelagibacterales bacterium]|nr:hypothetical protein [Pelagibacterales bacterium]
MCSQTFKTKKYEYSSEYATFDICEKCAIREYYGQKGKQGNVWKRERKEGLYFGNKI